MKKFYFATFAILIFAAANNVIAQNVVAQKIVLDKQKISQIDEQLMRNNNECAAYNELEFALQFGFKKDLVLPKLLENYELCGEFSKANNLRSNNYSILSQVPFKESKWDVECDQEPKHLVAAMKENYWKSQIGARLGKFYLGCKQYVKAENAAKSALESFIIVPFWSEEAKLRENYEVIIIAAAMQGKLNEAVDAFAAVLKRPSSEPKNNPKEYDAYLQRALGAVKSASDAGFYKNGFTNSANFILTLSEKRIKQKNDELKEQEEKVKFCNSALKSAAEINNSTAASSSSKGMDGKIAAWDYACIRIKDIINTTSNKCPWEVNQKLYQMRDTAKSWAYGLMKEEKANYGGIYNLGC